MGKRLKRAGRGVGHHVRRQAVGYLALAVALSGTAYAGGKAGSGKVGARDLKPMVIRDGQSVTVHPGRSANATAQCRRGEQALAVLGGSDIDADRSASVTRALAAVRKKGRSRWVALSGYNPHDVPIGFHASVLCLKR